MGRVHTIDYLRGLMALSILFYHLVGWTISVPQSESILGKLGIYGVSAFYIVSGMSMYLSYKNTQWSFKSSASFFVRRFVRLAPVYWIAMLIGLTYAFVLNPLTKVDWPIYMQNFVLIFGFIDPTKYVVTGGWSIGNEVVFYLFFPAIILSLRNKFAFLIINSLFFLFVYLFLLYFDYSISISRCSMGELC